MSRFVSWLKTSRVGLAARRTSMSSRLSANRRSSVSGVGLRDDRVLDLVDGVAEPVGVREVAVDDVVADRPQQVVRAVGQDRPDPVVRRWCDARGSQLASCTVSRKPSPSTRSISLTTIGRVRSSANMHDVDDAVGRLDLGALVALEDVLDDQRMEAEDGADLLDLLRRRRRPGRPRPMRSDGRRRPGRASSAVVALELPERHRRPIDGDADLTGPARPTSARGGGRPARRRGRSRRQRMRPGSAAPSPASIRAARSAASRHAAAERECRRHRGQRHERRDHEQPDHDRRGLARCPRFEGLDDQRVAQRPVAQVLGDVREVGVGRGVDLAPTGGRSSSSRRR